jgi:PTH1 family peptidyl-tRNA hydrolase
MYLIVGLGNPGPKYSMNRHNIGFMVCDYWLKSLNGSDYREEHKALTRRFKIEDKEILLAKPQTYMNNSGQSVSALLNFYKIPRENLLVIHDEIDFPFGTMKLQHNRSPGGQNGVKSVSEQLGTNEYARLRMGVGRPPHPEFSVADYVLGNFPKEEVSQLDQYLEKATDAVECFVFEGLAKASTKFNGPVNFG